MKKITITSSVENGNLKRNRKLIRDSIETFEGKDIIVTFERKKSVRRNPQNRYYFGVVVVLMQEAIRTEWGEVWSREQVHELLKSRFLYTEKVNEDTAEIIKLPKSTTECSVSEFEDYMTECREFALEWFNTTIPLPNEDLQLEL